MAVDMMTWARWWTDNESVCQIGDDVIDATPVERITGLPGRERKYTRPKLRVSTVFLGLDHNHGCGDPVLFETMVFGGPLDGEQWRYHTYAEAERGHAEVVAQVRIASAKVKSIAQNAGAT